MVPLTYYILFYVMATSSAAKDTKNVNYEEYFIEHEISSAQAKNAALTTDLASVAPPPGCQACTREEKHYCLGGNFINDHCCCDKRYNEALTFVPHTCYIGEKLCQPTYDCTEYIRLRKCCCNQFVLKKWKEKSSASPHTVAFSLSVIIIYFIHVYL